MGRSKHAGRRSILAEHDTKADHFALEIVAAEYGHVRGAGDFLRGAPEPSGRFETRRVGYLSTHPLDAERLAALEALAAERGWSTQGDLTPLAD